MRSGPNNNRRPRGRHHGGGNGGGGGGNGGGSNHGGGNHGGGGGGGGGPSAGSMNNNRPRSAASLRHQTFDSNGPDVRVRGNAWQVYEKYQTLARDASGIGDRIAAENYQQHAEHYFRIIEAINEATAQEQRQRPGGGAPGAPGQQPEVPANYYGGEGGQPAPNGAPQGMPNGNVQQQPAPEQAQAEVQMRNQPPSPFFAPEEIEDNNAGPEPLVARR